MPPLPPPRSFFSIARSTDIPGITSPSPLSAAVHDRVQSILHYVVLILKISMLVLSLLGVASLLSMRWHEGLPLVSPWCIPNATVSLDGRGTFSSITSAVQAAPSFSASRYCIHVRRGRYVERITIPLDKINIVIVGDGVDQTTIAPSQSDLHFATLLVQGAGFTAVDLTIENHQDTLHRPSVAVENWSDRSVFYRCKMSSPHEVLDSHEGGQFYRECQFIGTRSLIYGSGRAYFQRCSIMIDASVTDDRYVVAMQSRDGYLSYGGFVFHGCRVSAIRGQLTSAPLLGAALTTYARIIYMECSIDLLAGWSNSGLGSGTMVFGEYKNVGAGATYNAHSLDVLALDSSDASQYSLRQFYLEDWVPADIPHQLDI